MRGGLWWARGRRVSGPALGLGPRAYGGIHGTVSPVRPPTHTHTLPPLQPSRPCPPRAIAATAGRAWTPRGPGAPGGTAALRAAPPRRRPCTTWSPPFPRGRRAPAGTRRPRAAAQAAPAQLRHPGGHDLAASEPGARGGSGRARAQMWGIRAAFFPARLSPRRPARLPKASAAPCCRPRAAPQPPPREPRGGPGAGTPRRPRSPPRPEAPL